MIISFHGLIVQVGCARQVQRYAAGRIASLQADIGAFETEYDMLRALRHRSDFGRLNAITRQRIDRREAEVCELNASALEELESVWRPLYDAQAPFCENCMGNGVTMVGYGGEGIMICGNCGGTGVEP